MSTEIQRNTASPARLARAAVLLRPKGPTPARQRVVPRRAPFGFTLIELLIVVAIIGILASIAVQNMLNAQVRARVARAEADLHALGTALETYRIDNESYPPTPMELLGDRRERLARLTSPISYLSSLPLEVFERPQEAPEPYPFWSPPLNDAMKYSPLYHHMETERNQRGRWALFSRGPDKDYEADPDEGGGGLLMYYDPSNGIISNGDIMRFGP